MSHLPARIAQRRRHRLAHCSGHHSADPGRDDDRSDDARPIDAHQWRHRRRSSGTVSSTGAHQVRRRRGENDDGFPVQTTGSARMQWTPVSDHGRSKYLPLVVPDSGRWCFHDRVPRLDSDRLRCPLVHRSLMARSAGFRFRIAFRLQHSASFSGRFALPASSCGLLISL